MYSAYILEFYLCPEEEKRLLLMQCLSFSSSDLIRFNPDITWTKDLQLHDDILIAFFG